MTSMLPNPVDIPVFISPVLTEAFDVADNSLHKTLS